MPSPSNSTPRRPRSQASAPSRSAPPKGGSPAKGGQPRAASNRPRGNAHPGERTFDLTESPRPSTPRAKKAASGPVTDAGVRRRELKKKRNRQSAMVGWVAAAAATVMIGGMAAGVLSELRSAESRVAQKRATLADLKTQFEIGKKRLSALSSASGKERVLVENGFVKPGQRLLLFPKPTPKTPNQSH